MLHWPNAELNQKSLVGEELILRKNLVDHFLRTPDENGAAPRALGLESRPCERRPPSLAPDSRHHLGVGGIGFVGRLLRILRDVPMRVDADRQSGRVVSGATCRLAIELDQDRKSVV